MVSVALIGPLIEKVGDGENVTVTVQCCPGARFGGQSFVCAKLTLSESVKPVMALGMFPEDHNWNDCWLVLPGSTGPHDSKVVVVVRAAAGAATVNSTELEGGYPGVWAVTVAVPGVLNMAAGTLPIMCEMST